MFKNPYDNDVTTWSPQGRLYQVEYAMEAEKQGSPTVGLKNRDFAILAALKRNTSSLSAYLPKITTLDEHIGMSIAGLTADGRILARYLRNECMNERYSRGAAIRVEKLVRNLGIKMQLSTQRYDRRPYGVGILLAGYDEEGPHVFQIQASAMKYDCRAMAIGSRSQAIRTYLEKNVDNFLDCDKNQLIRHSLLSLRDSLPNDVELTTKNVSLAIVGKGTPFATYDDDEVDVFLQMLSPEERKGRGSGQQQQPAAPAAPGGGAAPMDTD